MKRITLFLLFFIAIVSVFAQKPCEPPGDKGGKSGCPDSTACGGKGSSSGSGSTGSESGTGADVSIPVLRAVDPNEIIGPTGYEQIIGKDTLKWVAGKQTLSYKILFENDPDFATAPAQNIRIEVPIHSKLNPSSVRIGDFGFRNLEFSVPPNSVIYNKRLDVIDSLGVYVDVAAGLDIANRKVFWVFQAVDPVTGLSTNLPANLGVLPVNDTISHRGEGFVTFTIIPNSTVQTRDSLAAQASIVFDTEETIVTNQWVNIVDAGAPGSNVSTVVSGADGNTAKVSWSGQDDNRGVGIDYYDLYVSENDQPFQLYQSRINATSYDFLGSSGAKYRFFTVATDLVGNTEVLKSTANNNVTLGIPSPTITATKDTVCTGQQVTLTATNCPGGIIKWSNGQTGTSINVTLSITTEYTANCTIGGVTSNDATPRTIVFGGVAPTATLSGTQTINAGQSAILTANFTSNGPWSMVVNGKTYPAITTNPYDFTVNPSTTTLYTLNSISNACSTQSPTGNNTALVTVLSNEQSITTSTISGSPFCTKATLNVGFTTTGAFNSGNNFTVQLSNPNGSFASGTTDIGTIPGTASGTILATIPSNAVAGAAYRIRVVSSSPAVTGFDNGLDLVIGDLPTATLIGNQTINPGQTATLTVNLTGKSPWEIIVNGKSYAGISASPYNFTVNPTTTTNYVLSSVENACGKQNISSNNTATVNVTQSNQRITTSSISGSPFCAGATLNVGFTVTGTFTSGNVFTAQLSDPTGSFDSGTTGIGTTPGTVSGTIAATLPSTLTAGAAYRIRVIASTPAITGTDNGANITIRAKATASLNGSQTIQAGQSATLTALLSGTSPWSITVNNQIYSNITTSTYTFSVTPSITTIYTLTSVSDVCGAVPVSTGNVATVTVGVDAACLPQVIWDKTLGGNSGDQVYSIITTSDGGYLVGGSSLSNSSGDKTENSKGDYDYWIVKLDANGQKQWDKTYGGIDSDWLQKMVATPDGYMLGGYSNSGISGDKTETSKGLSDYWVIKINNSGQKQWDRTIGGGDRDFINDIILTSDNGFLLGGTSYSGISGDKSETNKGSSDFWVVKITSTGQKQWDKTIGGNGDDYNVFVIPTVEGGFLLTGSSRSGVSGDKTEPMVGDNSTNPFETDYWLVKINSNGVKQWDKSYGGNQSDYLKAATATNDGGFLIGGESSSGISGNKSEASKGGTDFWILKINGLGQKQWDKTIGGNSPDILKSMLPLNDGSAYLIGSSYSNISGDKTENSKGFSDYWIVKVNSLGQKQWDRTIGGSNEDGWLIGIPSAINLEGNIVIGGFSYSAISGDKTEASKGGGDYWVVKMSTNCCVSKPDLIISDVAITKYTSNRVYYTAQIKNIGTANIDMNGILLAGYTSSDGIVNNNDVFKSSISTGGGVLLPNQTLNFSYSTDFSFTDSQYYLRLKIDQSGIADECDKNNNDFFKLVNKCTTTENLTLTGNVPAGLYATNQAVILSNATLNNYVLVVGKSIIGTPAIVVQNSTFMIGNCLNLPAAVNGIPNTTARIAKPDIAFVDSSPQEIKFSVLNEEPIRISLWNSTKKEKTTLLPTPISQTEYSIQLNSLNLNKTDTYILYIVSPNGHYAKVLE